MRKSKSIGQGVAAAPAAGTKRVRKAGPAAADPAFFLDNQLCFALYAASLSMTRLYRPALAEIGLTYPQYVVLLALGELQGRQAKMTVTALGSRVALDSGTLTPLLKRMEKYGLVARMRSPHDEREVHVCLTAAGHAAHRRTKAIQSQVGCATGLSAAAARRLTTTLARLRTMLRDAGGDPHESPAPQR